MTKFLPILLTLIFVLTHGISAHWDFAVTTKTKIRFFDKHWNEISSAAHKFDDLTALTLDETEDVVYFSDRMHHDGSIFSLRLANHDNNQYYDRKQQHEKEQEQNDVITNDGEIIEKIIQRTENENIGSIAYDPIESKLYWTDIVHRKIHYAIVDNAVNADNMKAQVLLDLSAEDAIPDGLAIDICRRKLYWTNRNFRNASIELIDLSLSPTEDHYRRVLINDDLYLPHGIIVDQIDDRIYWVVDQQGMHYSVESAKLDGSDRKVLIHGLNSVPLHLTVTHDAIFWTDIIHMAVWSHDKATDHDLNKTRLIKEMAFDETPYGIVARSNFLTNLQQDEHCSAAITELKHRLQVVQVHVPSERTAVSAVPYCMNGAETFMSASQRAVCVCKLGFEGGRCETNLCHNYCMHGGSCSVSSAGAAVCNCPVGFDGRRCQLPKCAAYCLNDGLCNIKEDSHVPECECRNNFGGARCEHNSTEICALYCRLLKHEPEADVPFGCSDICNDLAAIEGMDKYGLPKYTHLEVCKNLDSYASGTIIIVLTAGVVVSLILVLFIVHAVRRVYKPARPRIRKTFVVRKETPRSSPDTPLTNRPAMATEQCEITIENCCNMNICETPCFDPKLVQQSLSSCDTHSKEDRQLLIPNLDEALY